MKFIVATLLSAFLLQVGSASPTALLSLQRSLTRAEVEAVVNGTRQALARRTVRLVWDRAVPEREILMGPAGTPQLIRMTMAGVGGTIGGGVDIRSVPEPVIRLIEYTGIPARHCSGATSTAEMVIEYRLHPTTRLSTATARELGPRDSAIALPLEMLKTASSLTVGESRLVQNRSARALRSVGLLPTGGAEEPLLTGDPAPNPSEFVPRQSLWIDVISLLPLRWEISQREAIVAGVDFIYEVLPFERPTGVEVPKCVP